MNSPHDKDVTRTSLSPCIQKGSLDFGRMYCHGKFALLVPGLFYLYCINRTRQLASNVVKVGREFLSVRRKMIVSLFYEYV